MENKNDDWKVKVIELIVEADRIANENGVRHLFYNEQFMELITAQKLGHLWEPHTQGPDGLESETKKPTEYKHINLRSKNKGSFQFHWLSNKKMQKIKETENIFCGVRDGATLLEVYKIPTKKLLPLLEEKATGSKKINGKNKGHKSFSLEQIIDLGGELVYKLK
jgi:hypothetical protein